MSLVSFDNNNWSDSESDTDLSSGTSTGAVFLGRVEYLRSRPRRPVAQPMSTGPAAQHVVLRKLLAMIERLSSVINGLEDSIRELTVEVASMQLALAGNQQS